MRSNGSLVRTRFRRALHAGKVSCTDSNRFSVNQCRYRSRWNHLDIIGVSWSRSVLSLQGLKHWSMFSSSLLWKSRPSFISWDTVAFVLVGLILKIVRERFLSRLTSDSCFGPGGNLKFPHVRFLFLHIVVIIMKCIPVFLVAYLSMARILTFSSILRLEQLWRLLYTISKDLADVGGLTLLW